MFQTRKRGAPLFVLGMILIGWVGIRFTFLSLTAFSETPALATQDEVLQANVSGGDVVGSVADASGLAAGEAGGSIRAAAPLDADEAPGPIARINMNEVRERVVAPVLDSPKRELWVNQPIEAPLSDEVQRVGQSDDTSPDAHTTAASHNLLWMAAMAYVPVPKSIQRHLDQAQASGPVQRISLQSVSKKGLQAEPRASGLARFSVDSWLFLRQDGAALSPGGFTAPSYGRSQAGLVARYRLHPSSRFAPNAYVRGIQALAGPKDRDIALGLSARPFARLPLRAHIEARVSDQAGGTEVRPAAFVTSGLERRDLPLGTRLSFYGQAGYVGGDFSTGFVDGSLKMTREVVKFDLGSFSAGGGVWGGAQEGAARLDIGPSANVDLRLGDVPARLSVDYRVRVAGDAQPGSGAAVTLSTGF
ncbi:hypothetical protein [Qipengyuania sp. DGS5-3]|uniref:hypothetical protein n=1 Tax=Qipengyuania sp. DGS5-3 TaxID=3349632 RepID=UPI0036D3D166